MAEVYFGSADQQAIARRGRNLFRLLGHDPTYNYFGRAVGLIEPEGDDVTPLIALSRVQGYSNYAAMPAVKAAAAVAALEAEGMVPNLFVKWDGAEDALAAARKVVDAHALPEDLRLVRVEADTPDDLLHAMGKTAAGSGVLPPGVEVLSGQLRPGCCMMAVDADGHVVSCAGAAAFAHEDHPLFGGQAWWGMLATDPDCRGQRLALILGAQVMLDMETRFGFRDFMTGIVAGNASSEALCRKMGLAPTDRVVLGCADPAALAAGRMTK